MSRTSSPVFRSPRRLAALGASTAMVAGLLVATTAPAQAAPCVDPTISGKTAVPSIVAVGTGVTRKVDFTLTVADNCDILDGAVVYVYSPTADFDDDMVKGTPKDGVTTFTYTLELRAQDLFNDDAGTWETEFEAYDDATSSSVDEDGPDFAVVRGSRLSTNATPEPVKKGKTITISGALDRANWESRKYAGYGGVTATLQSRTPKGSYTNLKTVTTDGSGKLKTTVKASADACFRYVFAGNSTTQAATSSGDCVDVK